VNLKNTFYFCILSFFLISNAIYISLIIAIVITAYIFSASVQSILPESLDVSNFIDYLNELGENLSSLAQSAIATFVITYLLSVITISVISIYILYVLKIRDNKKIKYRR